MSTTANTATTSLLQQLESLSSEARNPFTQDIDLQTTLQMVTTINQQDALVAEAVAQTLPHIAAAIDTIVANFEKGGRLVYLGAGTSGRLGILDAVECRPTFSVPDDLVIGVIAGGERAITHAVEGAEDDQQAALTDLKNIQLSANDTLVGLSASGRTPYVLSGLRYAEQVGASTVSISCNANAAMNEVAEHNINPVVGPECISGSTRMKSGTAQKLVLNLLSTVSMIKLGKVYQNLMVDVNATNEKLIARAQRIVMQATGCSLIQAQDALATADGSVKLAILMILTGQGADEARAALIRTHGHLRHALE